jgi:hypothetical protein
MLRRQGFHTLAFAAYKKSLNWYLDGHSAHSARKALDETFHIDVKVSCFLSCMNSTRSQGARSSIAHFIYALDQANLEYDKMKAADPSELPKFISSYLNCIAYIYHFSPFATIYDGLAQSLSDARKTSNALKTLENKRNLSHLRSHDVDDIKQAVADLFDGEAVKKTFEQSPPCVFGMSFFITQVYRMLYPFTFIKYLKRKEETGYFYEIIRHVLHLQDCDWNRQVKNGIDLIDDLRRHCHLHRVRNFSDVISYVFCLKERYKN